MWINGLSICRLVIKTTLNKCKNVLFTTDGLAPGLVRVGHGGPT